MADYSIIADISTAIVRYLREKLCPSLITSPNQIDSAAPTDQNPDFILGLYLYDIQEERNSGMPSMKRCGQGKLKKAPKIYSLYYMLFVNGSSQIGIKAADTQKIIGKCAQVMGDQEMLQPAHLQPWLEEHEPPVAVTSSRINLEEKIRVWQSVDKPYQLCLFYKASPILLSSESVYDVWRVQEASFSLGIQEENGYG